ncbi:MAG: hypothetical protein PWR12_749 [Eubacteriaceae bacterium]|jgi:hypothetical protein|nr:hypothetical protein [Eubacteriaceae bacterium]MDK2937577.1 hypothetical protein [Eubacteriaceae bacterium]
MGKICPNCKKEIDAQAHFCTQCGYQFDSASREIVSHHDSHPPDIAPVKVQKPTGSSNKALIIVISILGALILIGVGVLVALQVTERFLSNEQSQNQDESNTSAVVLQLPTYSLPAGTYTGEQTVVINKPDGQNVAVYYTIDGSSPSQGSIKYEAPIIISSNLTLKSIAIDEAGNKSEVKTADYVIAAVQTPVEQQPAVDTTETERAQFENNIKGSWVVDDGSGFLLYYDFYDGYFYSGDGGVFGYEGTYTYSIVPGNNGTIGTVYGAGLTMYIDCNPLGDNAIYINGDYASYLTY